MRHRKGVDSNQRRSKEELRIEGRGKCDQDILCVKKNLFSIKGEKDIILPIHEPAHLFILISSNRLANNISAKHKHKNEQ